ncbi:hypothetical protein VTI74DRAFT_10564 [Chaetomium olivicolor]
MVQHMSKDTGDESPSTRRDPVTDESHQAVSSPLNSSEDHTPKDIITKLNYEQIVLVLRAPEEYGGYQIYSLTEDAKPEDSKPFSLSITQIPRLPDDSPLKDFLLDGDEILPPHLSPPRQVHVVVSTRSGLRQAQDFYDGVLRLLFKALGLERSEADNGEGQGYRVTFTKDSSTIRNLARELGTDTRAGEKTIILLSGDGGVVDLLNGLDQTQSPSSTPPTIALLPLGTGNALFHSLHKPHYSGRTPIPSPLVLGLRTLCRGHHAPLPAFKASFSPGAKLVSAPVEPDPAAAENPSAAKDHEKETPVSHLLGAIVASYGFHASLVWESDTPAYRAHGDKRFGMAAAELLKVAHGYEARVEVRRKGEERRVSLSPNKTSGDGSKFNYVLTTLVSNLEKTFTISPASRPLDGQLRLVHFGDVSGEKTMEIMMAAYRGGEHVGMEEVGYEEVEEVKVTITEEDPRWRKVCIDGSIVELERGGWMSIQREQRERLTVLVHGYESR